MTLKPDIVTALWVVAVAALGIFALRLAGGALSQADGDTAASLGKAILSITGG